MQCPSCGNACSTIDIEELGACLTCYQTWTASHDDISLDLKPMPINDYDDIVDQDYDDYLDYQDDGRYDDDPNVYAGDYPDNW